MTKLRAVSGLVFMCAVAGQMALAGDQWMTDGPGFGLGSISSDTTDGGAAFGGGGTVLDPELGSNLGLSLTYGIRLSAREDFVISAGYSRSSIDWRTRFAAVSGDALMSGQASSVTLMAGLRRAVPAFDGGYLETLFGVSRNTISNLEEASMTGAVYADIYPESVFSPAARIAVGRDFKVSRRTQASIFGAATYLGDFSTANTRIYSDADQTITPYRFQNAVTYGVGFQIEMSF